MGRPSKRRESKSDTGSEDASEIEDEVENEYEFEDDSNDDAQIDEDEENEEDRKEEKKDCDEDSSEENHNRNDAEMEELEKEYRDLRQQEQKQDILVNLRRRRDEDIEKGRALKNQKALWDKTLELRILLQKAFSRTNRLPKEPIKSSFCDSDSRVIEAYSDVTTSCRKTLHSLLELQEALIKNNPSITQATNGSSGQPLERLEDSRSTNGEGDDEWSEISQMQSSIFRFRDKEIDEWQRKTQVTTGAAAKKLHAFNKKISQQIAEHMRDPSRMVKGMQQNRSSVAIFGTVPNVEGDSKEQVTNPDGDPELLDDPEFYQQLIKEFLETFDPASSGKEMDFGDLKSKKTKKRKLVDRRASKSRKIRYQVHEKIVNFMAPQPMNLPPMAPKLFHNLFGLKTQKHLLVE